MHQGHLTTPMVSLEPFHILHNILSKVMAIHRGGTSSSNTYAPLDSNMLLGPTNAKLVYQTIAPPPYYPYAQSSTPTPQALASQIPMHPHP